MSSSCRKATEVLGRVEYGSTAAAPTEGRDPTPGPGAYRRAERFVSADVGGHHGLLRKELHRQRADQALADRLHNSSTSTLVQLRDPLADHAHADADELIYVVAGEGTHKVAGQERQLSGGVFTIVPRGNSHSIVRRGRQPLVIISTLSGPPCQTDSSSAQGSGLRAQARSSSQWSKVLPEP